MYPPEVVDPDVEDEPEVDANANIVRAAHSSFPLLPRYPYEHGGWREVGVTSTMVEQLCRMKGMALIVVRERAVIHRFDPESKEKTRANHIPVLVYNIWGDHAFFYTDADTRNGASQLPKRTPILTEKPQAMTLKVDEKFLEDNEVFTEMVYYEGDREELKAQIDKCESKTYWCFASELEMYKENIERDKGLPGFHTRLGLDPYKISCLIFVVAKKQAKGKAKSRSQTIKIKIRTVPDNVKDLQRFSDEFELKTNYRLPYRGESTAVLMNRAVIELMVNKRKYIPPAVRQAVSERCNGKCAKCGDAFGTKFDVDHETPLREGGLDDFSNMQALCRPCHATKCEQEEVTCTTRLHTLASEMSPEMLNMFHYAPKPKQVYWGGPTPKGSRVKCIDAISCRENAIVDSDLALPVFSPLDEPEFCHDEYGDMKQDPMYWDYIYIEVPDADSTDRFPYTGRRFYWKGAVRYLLAKGRIELRHLKLGIRATKHVSPSALNEAFKTIKELWVPVVYDSSEWKYHQPKDIPPKAFRDAQKGAILSCIGLWNSVDQFVWKSVKSTYESDAGGPVQRKRDLGEGVFEFKWNVDLVGLKSMRAIGQIPLDMEQVRIAEILEMMKPFELDGSIKRLGAVVDCVYFEAKTLSDRLKDALEDVTLPSGAPKFQIKDEEAFRSPTKWSSTPSMRHHELKYEAPVWKHFSNLSIDELVALIEQVKGALITGPAGTGKTWTMRKALKKLKRLMKSKGIVLKNLNCAIRHAAARLIDGSTIAHLLNKYRKKGGPGFAKNIIMLIDEASEISVSMWTQLAEWYLLGVRFVIIGDFDGQFLPMFDRWGKILEEKDIQTSLLFHSLCEGTRVHFTEYRRGDASAKPLFDFYCGLYPRLKLSNQTGAIDTSLEEARAFFKPCDDMPDVILCNSHYKRRLLNHAMNLFFGGRKMDNEKLYIPCVKDKTLGVTMLPQDMTIWKGMELLGCIHASNSKTVINGILYVVVSWDNRFVHLDVHPRYKKQPGDDSDKEEEAEEPVEEDDEDALEDPAEGEIPADLKLSHANVSRWLRLTHARCYGSIQGCTMEGQHVMLIDTRAVEGKIRHFSLRHMIVGMSRATHQDYVHFPTEKYETDLMNGAREKARIPMGLGGASPCDFTGDDFDDGDIRDLAMYGNHDLDFDGEVEESGDRDLALYSNEFDEFPHALAVVQLPTQLEDASEDEQDDSNALAMYGNDPDDYPGAIEAPFEVDEDGDVIM